MANNDQLNKISQRQSRQETGDIGENNGIVPFLMEKSAQLGDRIYLIVYKHHEVLIGAVQEGVLQLEGEGELTLDYLKELRMFSKNGEVYLWNREGKFKYRLRLDDQGEETRIYDEEHYMWGNKIDDNDDRTVFESNRGMRLTFPFPVKDNELPLKYLVRNYLGYDKKGRIQFYDARLVNFLDAAGKELYDVEI